MTFVLSPESGRSEVFVEREIDLSISVGDANVRALRVDLGDAGIEWKAHVRMSSDEDKEARQLVEATPPAGYLLVSRGDRALSVISSKMLRREIVVGAFGSKRELEDALGIGELSEHALEVEVGPEERASAEAIDAADEAIKTHNAEKPVLDAIERALGEGDEDAAARLMEKLKREERESEE